MNRVRQRETNSQRSRTRDGIRDNVIIQSAVHRMTSQPSCSWCCNCSYEDRNTQRWPPIRASQLLLITMDMPHEAAKEMVFVPSPQCRVLLMIQQPPAGSIGYNANLSINQWRLRLAVCVTHDDRFGVRLAVR
jgi:hypothetical protein